MCSQVWSQVAQCQYFYHSHSPEDRGACGEHGHIHLFARMHRGVHRIDESVERSFLQRVSDHAAVANTVNLLCPPLDAKSEPTNLFTLNRWGTGDHLFSAAYTLRLLSDFKA